jgi:hypothetical protein
MSKPARRRSQGRRVEGSKGLRVTLKPCDLATLRRCRELACGVVVGDRVNHAAADAVRGVTNRDVPEGVGHFDDAYERFIRPVVWESKTAGGGKELRDRDARGRNELEIELGIVPGSAAETQAAAVWAVPPCERSRRSSPFEYVASEGGRRSIPGVCEGGATPPNGMPAREVAFFSVDRRHSKSGSRPWDPSTLGPFELETLRPWDPSSLRPCDPATLRP